MEEWRHRLGARSKAEAGRGLEEFTKEEMAMYNGILVPSLLYGSETLEINAGLRKKVDAFEIHCLRPIKGATVRQNEK